MNKQSADEADVQSFIQEHFTTLFLSQSRRAQVGLLGSALLIASIWHALAPSALVWYWGALAASLSLLRILFTERWVRNWSRGHPTQAITALLALNGLLMAIPVLAFAELSDLGRAAVSIILLATATASVATTAGYKYTFAAFAAPMLVALTIGWWLTPADASAPFARQGIALLIATFLLFLVSVSRKTRAVFDEASRFRYGAQQHNRELQDALELASEANRAKTQFLAAASHDLRQPIHSMNAFVAALTLRDMDAQSREIVMQLDAVNQILAQQLDSLLDISKLDAGTVTPRLRSTQLDQLLASIHASMMPIAVERGLSLNLQTSGAVSVTTDVTLLTRILNNLVDNALKFTRQDGRVAMAIACDGEQAVMTVSDTGIGIPAEEQQRVFAEFYQVGNSERDRARGLGLGLSIVRRLCELLHIELHLSSALGQGTTVTLTFPGKVTTELDHPAVIPQRVMRPGQVVMVVDDEGMVRDSMYQLLAGLGCVVHLAQGSEQALAIASANRLDLVLSDFRLRGSDSGLHAIQTVLTLQPKARAALITGDTAPDRIAEAQRAGIDLLHKPVSLDSLLRLLQTPS